MSLVKVILKKTKLHNSSSINYCIRLIIILSHIYKIKIIRKFRPNRLQRVVKRKTKLHVHSPTPRNTNNVTNKFASTWCFLETKCHYISVFVLDVRKNVSVGSIQYSSFGLKELVGGKLQSAQVRHQGQLTAILYKNLNRRRQTKIP